MTRRYLARCFTRRVTLARLATQLHCTCSCTGHRIAKYMAWQVVFDRHCLRWVSQLLMALLVNYSSLQLERPRTCRWMALKLATHTFIWTLSYTRCTVFLSLSLGIESCVEVVSSCSAHQHSASKLERTNPLGSHVTKTPNTVLLRHYKWLSFADLSRCRCLSDSICNCVAHLNRSTFRNAITICLMNWRHYRLA